MPRADSSRLDVLKTYKLFIGGKFPRSESGRVLPAAAKGKIVANYAHASRKDLRDAVTAARKAQPGWAGQSAYLRGQILYRAAEMLEQRSAELEAEIARLGAKNARREVAQSVDRLVHYAGWSDKYAQIASSVNPVASAHFNFTMPEPTGVVVAVCPDEPPLLGLVSMIAPVIVSGNAVVAIASETSPLAALTFAEIIATCDMPGGVVNILSGPRAELLPHAASHMDVNAIVEAGGAEAAGGSAFNLKRHTRRDLSPGDWAGAKAESPYWILDTIEMKTAWHPIGV